jgi:hypothetical protein
MGRKDGSRGTAEWHLSGLVMAGAAATACAETRNQPPQPPFLRYEITGGSRPPPRLREDRLTLLSA